MCLYEKCIINQSLRYAKIQPMDKGVQMNEVGNALYSSCTEVPQTRHYHNLSVLYATRVYDIPRVVKSSAIQTDPTILWSC